MVKTIETRAVISAQDRTGQTFAQIAQKIRRMEDVATQASRRAHAAPQAIAARQARQTQSIVEKAVPVVTAAIPAVKAMRQFADQAGKQLHEQIRMGNAGMSAAEIAHAVAETQRLSREFKPIGQTEIMHMLRNMRSVVGTYEEAAHLAEPFLKLRVIAQHAAGAHASVEQINEDFDKLIKSAEIMGRTTDLRKFHGYMQGVAKALNVFGDTVKPYQYFEAAQMSRGAASYWSPEFVAGIMPTMIQHMGGAQAGTAGGAFYSALIGGKMTNAAVKHLHGLGLIDEGKVVRTKTGAVKGIQPGAVMDWRLAMSNPAKWVWDVYGPALKRKGITSDTDIAAAVAVDFSNRMARQFVTQLVTQRPLFEKDMALTHGAKALEAAIDIMRKDFETSGKSLSNAANSLSASLGAPFMEPLTAGRNALAEAMNKAAQGLAGDKSAATHAALGAGLAAGAVSAIGISGGIGLLGGGLSGAGAGIAGAAATMLPLTAAALGALGVSYLATTSFDYEHMRQRGARDRRELGNLIADRQAALARARRRGDAARVAAYEGEVSNLQASAAGIGRIAGGPRSWSALDHVAQARQQVDIKISADPVPIEGRFSVVPGSELLRIVDDFKRVSVKANLKSGIGSIGSTDMGNQQ